MNLILSNIFGLIALFFICFSYMSKKKDKFLIIQILANISYSFQYLFVNAITALVMNVIAILKSIVFYVEEKNSMKHTKIDKIKKLARSKTNIKDKNVFQKIRKRELWEFIIIEIIIIVAGIATYQGPLSLIPLTIGIVFTYGMWQSNLCLTYFLAFLASIGWIFYNIMYGAYTGALGSVVEMTFSIIGLIRVYKLKEINKGSKKNVQIK